MIRADGLAIWAADRTHARVHRLTASRAAPVVCIQLAWPLTFGELRSTPS